MFPYFWRANRSAASAVSSNTNDVVWKIGVARAPVVASGRAPAWIARVRNPHARSPAIAEGYRDLTNPITLTIAQFLTGIGIEVVPAELDDDCLLPGIQVDRGRLLVDESRLAFPGDLLHEAGHLA